MAEDGDGLGVGAVPDAPAPRVTAEREAHRLSPYSEGDRRTDTHAKACKDRSTWGSCEMSCRCWCHNITKHLNGDLRVDAVVSGRSGGADRRECRS